MVSSCTVAFKQWTDFYKHWHEQYTIRGYSVRFYDLIHSDFSVNWNLGPFSLFVFQKFADRPMDSKGQWRPRASYLTCLLSRNHGTYSGLDVARGPKFSFMRKISGAPHTADSGVSPVCQHPNFGCSLRNMVSPYYNEGCSRMSPCPSDCASLDLPKRLIFPDKGFLLSWQWV
jgi:hypothetical protein